MKLPRLVLVKWLDAYGVSPDWISVEDAKPSPLVNQSVGWLFHENDDCVVVIPHVAMSDHPRAEMQICGDMMIPRKAVVEIIELIIPHGRIIQ